MDRITVTEEHLQATMERVEYVLRHRIAKVGSGAYASRHEALGVIAEEYHELVDAVRDNNNRQRFIDECFDVAVAAIFALASKEAHPYKML